MKLLNISVFIVAFCFSLLCQEARVPLRSIELSEVSDFGVDQFRNIYVVRRAELIKYDPDAKKLYSFSNPIFGDIYQVDVRNAMNPYVFYKDVNQLVIVDNRLNSSTALNFTDEGFLDVQFISFADQNNVWFYDQATDKIYRFNMQSGKTNNQSLNITQISKSENLPQSMVSTIDRVFLNVPDKGIFVFDAVGAFEKLIPLKGVTSFDIRKNRLYALQNGQPLTYDLQTARVDHIPIEQQNIKRIKVTANRLYLLTEKGLLIYADK